ncbi:hypothetical protein B9Z19DRAFT_1134019 [Tuber borchii]|uniref:Allantoicase domain-containing protein n=1 Tax=Tuber borchii TaxID=42251 RepID=A0A2T6ZEV3_TUBBO|nr:hypothetical protein B9Z19DRAFT_1134019 [Tuber borchii]
MMPASACLELQSSCSPAILTRLLTLLTSPLAVWKIFCSDQNFGTKAANALLPGSGKDTGNGWETNRSREPAHVDWVVVKLGAPGYIEEVIVGPSTFVETILKQLKYTLSIPPTNISPKQPISQILYKFLFPTPGPKDPATFDQFLNGVLDPEIRTEIAEWYNCHTSEELEEVYLGIMLTSISIASLLGMGQGESWRTWRLKPVQLERDPSIYDEVEDYDYGDKEDEAEDEEDGGEVGAAQREGRELLRAASPIPATVPPRAPHRPAVGIGYS